MHERLRVLVQEFINVPEPPRSPVNLDIKHIIDLLDESVPPLHRQYSMIPVELEEACC